MNNFFKILLSPLILILMVLSKFIRFTMIICGGMITILASIVVSLSFIGLLFKYIMFKEFFMICFTCFLFSNYGLFALAHFFLDFLDYLIEQLKLR